MEVDEESGSSPHIPTGAHWETWALKVLVSREVGGNWEMPELWRGEGEALAVGVCAIYLKLNENAMNIRIRSSAMQILFRHMSFVEKFSLWDIKHY